MLVVRYYWLIMLFLSGVTLFKYFPLTAWGSDIKIALACSHGRLLCFGHVWNNMKSYSKMQIRVVLYQPGGAFYCYV